jgi:ADP-heptose:LPS heptosyltransferase
VATAQYAQFIDAFIKHRSPLTDTDAVSSFHILVTAGPNETELAKALVTALSFHHIKASVFNSKDGLVAFAEVIANSALYLAASTGPLHIAGALDVPTIGVFPARRSSSALRWQPINQPSRHWPISVPNDARDPEDLTVINWAQAGIQARAWFDQLSAQDKVTAQD